MEQIEYLGFNSIQSLKEIVPKYNPKSIFLVTGQNSYDKCGAKSILNNILKNYNKIHFHAFETNPKLKDIEKGINIFKKNNCDFVIAVGGGSVMDIAKSVNILSNNSRKPIDYTKNKKDIENKGQTLVAIPTTAGSGSEATHFAVVYIDKTKYSLEHVYMLPDYSIVDPQFTTKLPKNITASTGADALSQAIESFWCINSIDESKNYSKKAIKLVIENISNAVNNPTRESRKAMSIAAHLSGKAINITKTTASHAISYPITTKFGVPHGRAVLLTIPPMLTFNFNVTEEDLNDKRGIEYIKRVILKISELLGASNPEEASEKMTTLMKDVGLATKLNEVGVRTEEDIEYIIKNINLDRLGNNPRKLDTDKLRQILQSIR